MNKRVKKKKLKEERIRHERFLMGIKKAHAMINITFALINMARQKQSFINNGGVILKPNVIDESKQREIDFKDALNV